MSRDSVVVIATGYGLEHRRFEVPVPVGSSRPALGSTEPPTQWVPGALSPGLSGRGVRMSTHFQLVSRSRKYGSIHPLPYTQS
jgi:hypothetical protein